MRKIIILLILFIFLISSASAATLTVPSTSYKTVQSAINAAKHNDTVSVKSGIYNENLIVTQKRVNLIGEQYKYPKILGISTSNGGCINLNGFNVTKSGIWLNDAGANLIRNNYIYTKGVNVAYPSSTNTVMNNKFFNCGIGLYESYENSVTGNTISKASEGLGLHEGATCKTITGNTFSCCKIGVSCWTVPLCLTGNTYKGNTVNIKTGVY